jgi:hypothetical protein
VRSQWTVHRLLRRQIKKKTPVIYIDVFETSIFPIFDVYFKIDILLDEDNLTLCVPTVLLSTNQFIQQSSKVCVSFLHLRTRRYFRVPH